MSGRATRCVAVVFAAVLCLTAVVCLAGCGGHGHRALPLPRQAPSPGGSETQRTGGDRPPNETDRIRALLDARARALAAGDAAAYAATSTGPLRARDLVAVRRAARLGLRDAALALRHASIRGRRALLRVGEGWALRGIRGMFRSERILRAVRTRAGWRIASVVGTRGRQPWEVGDFRRVDEPHFVVLAPPGLDVRAAGVPIALAAGYARIASVLPRAPLRRRYLAVVAPDARVARALTADIRGVGGLAAVSDTAVREVGPARRVERIFSQRLLVVWPEFSLLPADERLRVLTHEFTHLVLAGSTSGRTPSWLVEGVALYVSGDRRDAEAAATLAAGPEAATSLRRLSGPSTIGLLTGAAQSAAYAYSSAAAFTIADTYGHRALLRLYEAFSDPSLPGRPGPALVDLAMRRTLGVGLAEFETRLRAALL